MSNPTGYVFYKGPSMIDGKPIVAIAVLHSDNVKTGDMVQTHILPDNGASPFDNTKSGGDYSVCGDCDLRHFKKGPCYVDTLRGPGSVFKTYLAGKYPYDTEAAMLACADREVRLGAYGDPFAVPFNAWANLTLLAKGWTGYTHQWRRVEAQALKMFCMASVDNEEQRREAFNLGWRTFRIRRDDAPLLPNEFACPASEEMGNTKKCIKCMACGGGSPKKASPVIVVHGNWKGKFNG